MLVMATVVRTLARNAGPACRAALCAAALLLTLSLPAAAQVVHVCFEPADTTVALGDFVTVRVTADGPAADLKGYLARGTYNTSVLTLQATTPGSVLTGKLATFIPYTAPPDTLGFDAAVLIGTTQGPGTLGYFQFQATAPGICDLILTEILMRNSLNQPYSVALCNGRVRVVTVTPTQQLTWGEIKARHQGS